VLQSHSPYPAVWRQPVLLAFSLGIGAFLACGVADRARGSDIVTLRTWADPAYSALKAGRPSSDKETYVVVEGEYFDGGYWDPSISQKSLSAIMGFLAPTLTKQGYFPAKGIKGADELLVVHWGTTIGYINEYEKIEHTLPATQSFHSEGMNPMLDTAPVTEATKDDADAQYDAVQAALMANQAAHIMQTSTAEGLLGYTKALIRERQKMATSALEMTLEANMHEDRYFVILQAYDFPRMQRGDGKKLLWSVHMSIRAPGMNFNLALPRMGQVASEFYGQNNDDVVTGTWIPGRHASVDVGPLTVLSDAAPTPVKK
jgi:hypothetical protein